jgi:hypothetical protein
LRPKYDIQEAIGGLQFSNKQKNATVFQGEKAKGSVT